MNIRIKILTLVFSGLVMTGCSDDKAEKNQLLGKVTAPVVEQVDAVKDQDELVADKMEELSNVSETSNPAPVDFVEHTTTDNEPITEQGTEVQSEPEPEKMQISASEPRTHTIKAAVTKFLPMVLFVNPGDTITWENMAGHDTSVIDGMIPEGVEGWHSKMGEQFSITLDKEGAYVYKCTPHASLGMLGAIIVGAGEPENLDQITGHPDNKGMVKRTIRKMTKALDKRE